MRFLFLLITVIFPSFAFAGTGMILRLSAPNMPNVTLVQGATDCEATKNSMPKNNNETYYESDDSYWPLDHCYWGNKNSHISFTLMNGSTLLKNFDINLNKMDQIQDFSEITPDGSTRVTFQHFSNYGSTLTRQSQDRFEITVTTNPFKEDEKLPLNKQLLIGSHDSGTSSIANARYDNKNHPFTSDALYWFTWDPDLAYGWEKSQNTPIIEQLKMGVRYLDLRLCGSSIDFFHPNSTPISLGSNIVTCHAQAGDTFQTVLDQVSDFIDNHNPNKDVVILDINHIYGMTIDQAKTIITQLNAKFGEKVAEPTKYQPSTPIQEFKDNGKQVVVIMSADADNLCGADLRQCPGNDNILPTLKSYSNFWLKNTIVSDWHDTNDETVNENKSKADLDTRTTGDNVNKLFVLQSQLTPVTGDVLSTLDFVGSWPRNLKDFTGTYQFNMSKWIQDNGHQLKKGGFIIIRDFVPGWDGLPDDN